MRGFLPTMTLSSPAAGRPPLVSKPRPISPAVLPSRAASSERSNRQRSPRWRLAFSRHGEGPDCGGSGRWFQFSPERRARSSVGAADASARVFRSPWRGATPDGAGKICLAVWEPWARLFGRASESVTRSDRRERELRFESPFPPLTARPNRRREDVAGRRWLSRPPAATETHPYFRVRGSWRSNGGVEGAKSAKFTAKPTAKRGNGPQHEY